MATHITRRIFVKGAGLLSVQAALAACSNNATQEQAAGPGAEVESSEKGSSPLLAIIHTNDSHGHDVEVKASEDADGNFSMAAVPALRDEWEKKGYEVLVLDAGDATQGMPLVDTSSGEAAIAFMNSCGYDLMCMGNHDFDRGDDQIKKYEETAEFPLLSANVLVKETGQLRFTPNKVFELSNGTKVGVFSLTTPATTTTVSPAKTEPFEFLAGDKLFACAQAQVDELRSQGADIVVCLAHLGNDQACQPNTSRNLLENVHGIDLFIDGHDHKLVDEEVQGTLLVQTGCFMSHIGLVLIDEGIPQNQSVAYGEFAGIDTPTQAIIDDVNERVETELRVKLGETPFVLEGDMAIIRSQETNLGDLATDAMLYDAKLSTGKEVDAALVNSGAIRATIDEGIITLGIIKSVFPYSGNICTINVTGAELLEAIEAGSQSIGEEGKFGAFPQVSGIEFTLDATVPYERGELYPDSTYASPASPGTRVTIHRIAGEEFDEERTYTIAVNDFLTLGGDTYYPFKLACEREQPIMCDFDYEAFASFLTGPLDHRIPDTYAKPQGRITIITK